MSVVSAKKEDLGRDKTRKDTSVCMTLLNQLKREEIRTDCPMQRSSNQWKKDAKDGLVVTAILHEDIDSIKMCEQIGKEGAVVWVIDGIQRLTTLSEYKNNVFRLGKNIEKPIVYYQVAKLDEKGKAIRNEEGCIVYDVVEYDLRDKYYKNLPEQLRESFDSFPIDIVKQLNCSDEEVGYHIRRYNRQTSMNASQSAITYMDYIAKDIKNIAQGAGFFKRECYTESERKKGIIDRVVSESIMLLFHADQWKRGGKQMGQYLNSHSNAQELQTLDDILLRLNRIITSESEPLFTTKNSFIYFAAFNYFTTLELSDDKFNDFLCDLKETFRYQKFPEYKNESFETLDANRSTKDKKVVLTKLEMLKKLMSEYFKADLSRKSEYTNLPEFVTDIVGIECNDDDVAIYEESLNDYTVEVDNTSNLLAPQNHPSLVALTAYAFKENQDTYLSNWMIRYFKNHNTYISDQKKNYLLMRDSFNDYLQQKLCNK